VIPRAYIVEWRANAPWKIDAQVEQDLIISRLLVEFFLNSVIQNTLLFRGGTALHKLFLGPPVRYSEDLDLVQKEAGPIGPVLSAIRSICDRLLGNPRTRQKEDSVMLIYRVDSEIPPVVPLRIKVEVNTREHLAVFPALKKHFFVQSRWFSSECRVNTYSLEELLATKLRALYQRKKGRDLFDLWYGLTRGKAEPGKIVEAFRRYLESQGLKINREQLQRNLLLKIKDRNFLIDTKPLLRPDITYSAEEAYSLLEEKLLNLLV
jgi:predicted nucleotidyltransferase component of viral defense system